MFEKVNPSHPDKIADRIAGAIVDLAYSKNKNPKVAVEVLIGHNRCYVIIETSEKIDGLEVREIIKRITNNTVKRIKVNVTNQDEHLAKNQAKEIRCGDNGIFKGVPVTKEQKCLSLFSRDLYENYPYDGKFIIYDNNLIVCQSNCETEKLKTEIDNEYKFENVVVNPLGDWTGGTSVDSGATNRKLGSDMGDAVTGGGLHGKDLSKADVSVNIYAHLLAQKTGKTVELHCAIGDNTIDGKPYSEIVGLAREYINNIGGFEKFAEWGLI